MNYLLYYNNNSDLNCSTYNNIQVGIYLVRGIVLLFHSQSSSASPAPRFSHSFVRPNFGRKLRWPVQWRPSFPKLSESEHEGSRLLSSPSSRYQCTFLRLPEFSLRFWKAARTACAPSAQSYQNSLSPDPPRKLWYSRSTTWSTRSDLGKLLTSPCRWGSLRRICHPGADWRKSRPGAPRNRWCRTRSRGKITRHNPRCTSGPL